jgi:hypothetical protein
MIQRGSWDIGLILLIPYWKMRKGNLVIPTLTLSTAVVCHIACVRRVNAKSFLSRHQLNSL